MLKLINIKFANLHLLPDKKIESGGVVSGSFLDRGINTFHEAAQYIKNLPYGPDSISGDSMVLFSDGKGTCVTKHGIIARLAMELNLCVTRCKGVYPLTGDIITGAGQILQQYKIPYIPSTHCFLSCNGIYVDLTAGNDNGKNCLIDNYFIIFRVDADEKHHDNNEFLRNFCTRLCLNDYRFGLISVENLMNALNKIRSLKNNN